MIDTTTPQDLAAKIEWVGFQALSSRERALVGTSLEEVSRHLPRLLAIAVWACCGQMPPPALETRSAALTIDSFQRRQNARAFFRHLLRDGLNQESEPR